MAVFATKKDVEEIVGRVVGEIISDALQLISERFDKVDQRFEQVDQRFEQVDQRFEQVDQRFDMINSQFKVVDDRFDRIEGDIRDLSTITMRIDSRLGDTLETLKTHSAQIRQIQRKIA